MAKKGTARWTGGVAIAVVLALAVAGCGGDGDSSDPRQEAAYRKQLLAGAAKLTAAKSFQATVALTLEEDFRTQGLGCLALKVDNGRSAALDMRTYDVDCSGGSEGSVLIAIGHRAWAESGTPGFTEAKVAPRLLRQVGGEQTNLHKLFTLAEDLEVDPAVGGTDEGEGALVDARTFSFSAPASAFPESGQSVADDVEFVATLDRGGFLRELILNGTGDADGATVTEKYKNINRELDIRPPDPSQVNDHGGTIGSRQELDELLGVP